MNTPDLETRIRSYYGGFTPDDSTRLLVASQAILDDARRPRPARLFRGSLRLAATLAAAVVLLAVLVLPRAFPAVGPESGRSSPTAGSAGPTFDVQGAVSAEVDDAGLIRTGGLWAAQGPYLLTSTDDGKSWRAATLPAQVGSIFVLDPEHAWAIGDGSQGGGPAAGHLVVYRTADGGRTWSQAPAAADFPCDTATFSFVDAAHGFLECSTPPTVPDGQPVPTPTKGSGTVLATTDGGATWVVAGQAVGLGPWFTASDANTLWSASDFEESLMTGVQVSVSRDAGRTWSTIELADLASVPKPADIGVAAGPGFWDGSNGAFAVLVRPVMSAVPQAVWFYRTSDGGRSWTVVKKTAAVPLAVDRTSALVGRTWAIIGTSGFFGITASSDFGASWTDAPGFGMPPNTAFFWVELTDKDHGAATAFLSAGAIGLMLTSDGGRTWHPADFGDARTKLSVDPVQDLATARTKAGEFTVTAYKTPESAWGMLSVYSQQKFGSSSAFQAAEAALAARTAYSAQPGEPTRDATVLGETNLGAPLWQDLTASADMSRAYAVVVTFPVNSAAVEPPETLVIAPLAATGEWRVWVATAP